MKLAVRFVVLVLGMTGAALLACGPLGHGAKCRYQSDCIEACIMEGDPEGEGTCGPYRQLGQGCTRPNYALHDCAPGLQCTSNAICEEDTSGSNQSCPDGYVNIKSYGCLPECVTDSECDTNCCASAGDGQYHVCAPSKHCGGSSSCPSGTFQQYEGGPCVSQPSSCPNDWEVCNCPDYHGTWCHPGCDDYLAGEGGPGTYCSGTSC